MNRLEKQALLWLLVVLIQGCNTLYNSKTIGIEILIPGSVKIKTGYKKAALKYNNINVAPDSIFASYFEDTTTLTDQINSDSIASKIYFDVFVRNIMNSDYFNAVSELPASDFSNISVSDSLTRENFINPDSLQNPAVLHRRQEVYKLTRIIRNSRKNVSAKDSTLFIDPGQGLYTRNKLEEIADETGADMLVSLDFFAAVDGIYSPAFYRSLDDSVQTGLSFLLHAREAKEVVMILAGWSFYDLNRFELTNHIQKIDTVEWVEPAYTLREAKRLLPPRKDAVFNAADLAATDFARFLIPHWVSVDRIYYRSADTELKQTQKMVNENRWIEAAEIWKRNINNRNKTIAAKSMFNLALACEMNGDIDAAIDWVTKSFLAIGNQNEIHAWNCNNYIRILAQRKLDIKKIEN